MDHSAVECKHSSKIFYKREISCYYKNEQKLNKCVLLGIFRKKLKFFLKFGWICSLDTGIKD